MGVITADIIAIAGIATGIVIAAFTRRLWLMLEESRV